MRLGGRVKTITTQALKIIKVNQTLLFTLLCIMYTGTVSIYASPPVFSSFTSWESGAIVPFKRTELEKSQITC